MTFKLVKDKCDTSVARTQQEPPETIEVITNMKFTKFKYK